MTGMVVVIKDVMTDPITAMTEVDATMTDLFTVMTDLLSTKFSSVCSNHEAIYSIDSNLQELKDLTHCDLTSVGNGRFCHTTDRHNCSN